MSREGTFKLIEKLNNAACKLRLGVSEIKSTIPFNDEIDLRVWRIEKEIKLLHKAVLIEVKKLDMNEEFKNIINQLEGDI
ncbi:MAG TPA: hypothetical protein ENI76_02285 [Ignavibacteria bacterium]|nr:hypothetical protein [Ignavibacteria bacterium]